MRTVTFYSYKGGTGRTLLMANIAIAAVQLGRRVVVLDLDLEAPGLAYKLRPQAPAELRGAVDWLAAFRDDQQPQVQDYTVSCEVRRGPVIAGGELLMIPAGRAPSPQYFDTLSRLHLDEWIEAGGVVAFQSLKQAIFDRYEPDYLLIDSRTGITATNSVTTRVLADAVVALALDSPEQLDGTRSVLRTLQPLTSLETGENLDLHVVLSRFAADSKPDDPSARTSEEQRALNSVQRFLTEPAWPARNTLEFSSANVHLVRMDMNLARREFVVLDQPRKYSGSLFKENLSIAASVLAGLVGPMEQAELHRQLELVLGSGGRDSRGDTRAPDLLSRVDALRRDAVTNPGLTPELAAALAQVAKANRMVGNTELGLESAEEAVSIYRALAEQDPKHMPDLAAALRTYADLMDRSGRPSVALQAMREVVGIHRELGSGEELGTALRAYADLLARNDRVEDALETASEAVAHLQGLRIESPELAYALDTYADMLDRTGRLAEALAAGGEAIRLYREFALDYQPWEANLAHALGVHVRRLDRAGRSAQAADAAGEEIYFSISSESGVEFVAPMLLDYSLRLADLGRTDGALRSAKEAVAMYRHAAAANVALSADLGRALHNLADMAAEAGTLQEALQAAQEALALRRSLAQADPLSGPPDLAESLVQHATLLVESDQLDHARTQAQEAVEIYRRLAETEPELYGPSLARAEDLARAIPDAT